MKTSELVEKITDLCEPYSDGEPDLYDLPIYSNGVKVSEVVARPNEGGKPERIEIVAEYGRWESIARAIEAIAVAIPDKRLTISESDALRKQLDKLTSLYSS